MGSRRTLPEAKCPFFPGGRPVDVLGELLGRIGLNKADALSLTRDEMDAVMKAAVAKEKDEWKRFRWLATVIVNIEGKSTKKMVQETDLLRFDDEQKTSSLRALLESYGRHDKLSNSRS